MFGGRGGGEKYPDNIFHHNFQVKCLISRIHLVGRVTRLVWRHRQKISSEAMP